MAADRRRSAATILPTADPGTTAVRGKTGTIASTRTGPTRCWAWFRTGPQRPRIADPARIAGGPRRTEREPEGELAGTGTGFVVDADGAIMTNAHVVRGCRSVTIGKGTPAEIVAVDEEVDLAVVRADGGAWAAIAEFAEDPARLNSDVTVIGYPLHGILGGINVTRGAVSSPTGLGGRANEFQISAAVQPGNSGGPVLNATGAVVGVVRSKLNAMRMADVTGDIPQNINFAIRAAAAKVFLVSNGIFYRTATAGERLPPAELAVAAQGRAHDMADAEILGKLAFV